MGKKKRPFYRLVVLDSRTRRDGAYLANLGYYNPFVDPHEVDLRSDEIIEWLGKGAQLSGTARSLLKREGLLYQFSLVKQGLSAEDVARKMDEWRPAHEARLSRAADDIATRKRQIAEAEQRRKDEAAKAAAAEAAAAEAPAEEAAGEPAEGGESADDGEQEAQ
jgi:small subunit ribosomal protein S16